MVYPSRDSSSPALWAPSPRQAPGSISASFIGKWHKQSRFLPGPPVFDPACFLAAPADPAGSETCLFTFIGRLLLLVDDHVAFVEDRFDFIGDVFKSARFSRGGPNRIGGTSSMPILSRWFSKENGISQSSSLPSITAFSIWAPSPGSAQDVPERLFACRLCHVPCVMCH
jgi:hypothetical protein